MKYLTLFEFRSAFKSSPPLPVTPLSVLAGNCLNVIMESESCAYVWLCFQMPEVSRTALSSPHSVRQDANCSHQKEQVGFLCEVLLVDGFSLSLSSWIRYGSLMADAQPRSLKAALL